MICMHLRRAEDGVLTGTGFVQYRFAHQLERAMNRVSGFSMRRGARNCYITKCHVELDLNMMNNNVDDEYRCSLDGRKDVMERPGRWDVYEGIRYRGRENDYIQKK